jgi:hypothetical protein
MLTNKSARHFTSSDMTERIRADAFTAAIKTSFHIPFSGKRCAICQQK